MHFLSTHAVSNNFCHILRLYWEKSYSLELFLIPDFAQFHMNCMEHCYVPYSWLLQYNALKIYENEIKALLHWDKTLPFTFINIYGAAQKRKSFKMPKHAHFNVVSETDNKKKIEKLFSFEFFLILFILKKLWKK